MSVYREGLSVGVLDGLMYAIGGYDGEYLKVFIDQLMELESSILDMELCRFCRGLVALDGLLFVIGGETKNLLAILWKFTIQLPILGPWRQCHFQGMDYEFMAE